MRRLVMLAAALMAAAAVSPVHAARQPSTPHIILGIVDDAQPGIFDRMPALAPWRAKGTEFTRARVDFSLCAPGRATLFTGLVAHNHGVLGEDEPAAGWRAVGGLSWLRKMRAAGYRVACVGKWINGATNYKRWGCDDTFITAGLDGDRFTDPVIDVNGTPTPFTGQTDAILAQHVVDIVNGLGTQPTVVVVGFLAPHAPRKPAEPQFVGSCDGYAFPRTPAFNEADKSDKPEFIAQLPVLSQNKEDKLIKSWREGCEVLRTVDAGWAAILARVEARGLWQHTLAVLLSDNGFLFGHHGYSGKLLGVYDDSIRVPMMAWGVDVPQGAERRQLVSNQDIGPTALELAGLPADGLDGRSIMPLLRGSNSTPFRSVHCGFGRWGVNEDALPGVPGGGSTYWCATENFRYGRHVAPGFTNANELYDVNSATSVDGPHAASQLTNVAELPAYELDVDEFRALAMQYRTCEPGECFLAELVQAEQRRKKRQRRRR